MDQPAKRARTVGDAIQHETATLATLGAKPVQSSSRVSRVQSGLVGLSGGGPDDATVAGDDLVIMILDVEEGPSGSFHVWGRCSDGRTAMLQVPDYCPYVYVAAPARAGAAHGAAAGGAAAGGDGGSAAAEWSPGELASLLGVWNSRLPSECRLSSVEAVTTRPIMFYRPTAPAGAPHLRLVLRPGGSARKAAAALPGLMARDPGGVAAALGMRFGDTTVYESDVKLTMRFLCDSALSGGAWLYLPCAERLRRQGQGSGGREAAQHGPHAAGTQHAQHAQHGQGPAGAVPLGYTPVPPAARVSSCDVEVVAPWRALQSLTPDATQLADPAWCPEVVREARACTPSAAPSGLVSGASGSGSDAAGPSLVPEGRTARPGTPTHGSPGALSPRVARAVLAASEGPIAPLTVVTVDVLAVTHDVTNRTPVTAKDDPIAAVCCDVRSYGTGPHAPGGGASPGGAGGSGADGNGGAGRGGGVAAAAQPAVVVFMVAGAATYLHPGPRISHTEARTAAVARTEVRRFETEGEMLLAWKEWMLEADPDIIATFQVRDTLGALRERFERLRLEGGGLALSRLAAAGRQSAPLTVKSVVMYSAAWVKSQSRMASTSNQETFRADIRGRIVMDVLRQVLTSQSLATFSLVDCCQSLLGCTLEVLGPGVLSALAAEAAGRQPLPLPHGAPAAQAAWAAAEAAAPAAGSRLARYAARRVGAVVGLLERLATLPEAFEMARVTGLTLNQVQYNAQMIRTWSLLHRNAHRQNYIIGGKQEQVNLIESPFLMHPIENRTAGLYRTPVATLDFASLYPSLYRAHNLCYTTLVHPSDVAAVGRDRCGFSPTGHAFVKPEVRPGILPAILAALMSARAATRAALKGPAGADPAAAAVLESRQRALKVTANALYGFTGAGASPLQCAQLADSCLALGAAACRRAAALVGEAVAAGRLGRAAAGGAVIYAQTDSLFVHFPRASPLEAVALGRAAAALVTAAMPPPMALQYERVLCPFLLLHVNRYAGRALDGEPEAADPEARGKLLVKGVRSMWRQSAPIVSGVLQGCLERILLHDNVPGAVAWAEEEVRRLLSGRVELGELVMTGGLWRITGQQVAAAAASEAGEGGEAGGGGAPPPEDVRGPHAALAVRLRHRDPGRRFLLGERLGYVLLAGARLQDEAAEDPLAAAQRGAAPALELYWRNKLQPPLKELMGACLSPAQLQALLTGPHTMVRVDTLGGAEGGEEAAGSPLPPPGLVPGLAGPGSPASPQRPAAGRGAGGGGGGGGYGLGMSPRSPPSAGKGRGGKQRGLSQFFRQTARCLACKQTLPQSAPATPGRGADASAPGLCPACTAEPDTWPGTYLAQLADDNAHTAALAAALSACASCHSGGAAGPVLCENGECCALFARLGAARRLGAAGGRLERLDACEPW